MTSYSMVYNLIYINELVVLDWFDNHNTYILEINA